MPTVASDARNMLECIPKRARSASNQQGPRLLGCGFAWPRGSSAARVWTDRPDSSPSRGRPGSDEGQDRLGRASRRTKNRYVTGLSSGEELEILDEDGDMRIQLPVITGMTLVSMANGLGAIRDLLPFTDETVRKTLDWVRR